MYVLTRDLIHDVYGVGDTLVKFGFRRVFESILDKCPGRGAPHEFAVKNPHRSDSSLV